MGFFEMPFFGCAFYMEVTQAEMIVEVQLVIPRGSHQARPRAEERAVKAPGQRDDDLADVPGLLHEPEGRHQFRGEIGGRASIGETRATRTGRILRWNEDGSLLLHI